MPLLVLSNRLPYTVVGAASAPRLQPSTGGVSASLDALLRRRGGVWIGWSGLRDDAETTAAVVAALEGAAPYRIVPVALGASDIDSYYDGVANRMLWPLLHGMPDRATFAAEAWSAYRKVNDAFAAAALAHAEPGAPVWLHDYHLLLASAAIRKRAPEQRVALFLHVPFPEVEVLRRCPWHDELVRGMLGADVIGFQTERFAARFLDAAESLGVELERATSTVRTNGRSVRVGAFPIGADFARFDAWARAAPPAPAALRTIIGVDRLDYTKGLLERLAAYARLFELHPEHRGRVVLVQIAVPSRPHLAEYRAVFNAVEAAVGALNRRWATAGWTPVDYRCGALAQDALARIFRRADIALVTPLSDGMNLVAKEYVASQVDAEGVLVLSRDAGAAESMAEALIVDPRDVDTVAEALHRALSMEPGERSARMLALRRREQSNDTVAWAERFLAALACAVLE